MFRLEDLTLFVRAAALNSFSDAAREVGVQPAQVSSAIKRLESTLAIRLFRPLHAQSAPDAGR